MTWFDRRLLSVRFSNSRGTVTAELVLALPAVLLIITLAVAAMSLQFTKVQLIGAAAAIANAVARDESPELIDNLVDGAGEQVQFELQELEDLICVKLTVDAPLAGIDIGFMKLDEKQCARVLGK